MTNDDRKSDSSKGFSDLFDNEKTEFETQQEEDQGQTRETGIYKQNSSQSRIPLYVGIGLVVVLVGLLGFQVLKLSDSNDRLKKTLEQTLSTDTRSIETLEKSFAKSEKQIEALENLNGILRNKIFEERNRMMPTGMDFNLKSQSRDSLVLLFNDNRSFEALRQVDSLALETQKLLDQNLGLRQENAEFSRLLQKVEMKLERSQSRGEPDSWDVDPCAKRLENWQTLLQSRNNEISHQNIVIDSLKKYIEGGITGRGYRR